MPIEKKHVHLDFYKQVWPSLPLEPVRCGFKRNFIVQNASWPRARRKFRGEKERERAAGNAIGYSWFGDKMVISTMTQI